MLYLIPAWYREEDWSENIQYWYRKRTKTEFDDTVKQVQLFQRNKSVDYAILLLAFSPNFRHFLHRQGVMRAPYWSCFDAICEIRRTKPVVFSYRDISWPPETEFVYTPFAILAYRQGKKYAKVEFGEDGNPIQIDMYENDTVIRQNIYDDRGFVSETIRYRDGKPFLRDYLMENGIWKMREYCDDGHVEINMAYPWYRIVAPEGAHQIEFSKSRYESTEKVIEEVLRAYLEKTDEEDIFCVAMHSRHTGLLTRSLRKRKLIASFFHDRDENEHDGLMLEMLRGAGYVITDSQESVNAIRREYGRFLKGIMYISPFDSRVDSGISQQLNVQKILVPIDGLDEGTLTELCHVLGDYCSKNETVSVSFFTRTTEKTQSKLVLEQQNRERNKKRLKSLPTECCVDELAVSKCLREQRILLDFRKSPELYLQVVGLSMGIPMIVRTKTQFIEPNANGLLINSTAKLPAALDFYLNGLENWNAARVAAYEVGKQFSTEVLLDKWKEVLASFE